MAPTMIRSDDVELCAEAFGDPADPALLLVMGAKSSMLWWPEGFCRMLADGGRYVIRYDHRDTGRSTTYPPGRLGYTMDDLADDALRVLDAFDVAQAHAVGFSLGGFLLQLLAVRRPERLRSLTLMMTGPYGIPVTGVPAMAKPVLLQYLAGYRLDWNDDAAVIDYWVATMRLLSGTAHPFDEAATRQLTSDDVRRARHFASTANHTLMRTLEPTPADIATITAPTLVIHGTADPVMDLGHGIALADAIPGARLLTLPGAGHALHAGDWQTVASAILTHPAPA